ncbi:MAG: hypothetical protein JST80_11335 [Bdellovibrionales bacterium]|nr:hypothetical protein [Bdellovibrionales bacterium]
MSAPVGWLDASGNALKVQFTDTSTDTDLSFECRAGYQSEVASLAWHSCTPNAGYVVPASSNHNANGVQLNNGTYIAEVRVKNGNNVLRSASSSFYVHPSLNNLADCTQSNSDASYFTEAAKYLSVNSHFGSATQLNSGPFKQIEWASQGTTSFATLRKLLAVNSDNSLIILRRHYSGFAGQGCSVSVGVRSRQVQAIFSVMSGLGLSASGSNHSMFCDALVINADGDGACFQNGLGRPAFIAKVYSGFKSNLRGSYRSGNAKHMMFRSKVNGSDSSALADRANIIANEEDREDDILVLNP